MGRILPFLEKHFPKLIFGGAGIFILWWFRLYFTDQNIASVDLPSHISLSRSLQEQILAGRITFYDHTAFTGFPAFRFYGFVPALGTALLGLLFDPFGVDGIVLATHLILVVGMALFPLSLAYAARPLLRELLGDEETYRKRNAAFAAVVVAFSFWFLNHDQQWYGIGAAAPMNIGLFAQLFGWHLLLLYVGWFLGSCNNSKSSRWRGLALLVALLPLCHTLTFVYVQAVGGFFFLLFREQRGLLLRGHVIGLALAGFWFIPTLALLGHYTPYDVHRPAGDFLEIFFRYPWYGLWRTGGSFLRGEGRPLELIPLLLPFIVLAVLAHPRIKRDGLTFGLFFVALLGILVCASGFIATSMPLGLHYYRFTAYHFLLLLVVCTAVPFILGAASRRHQLVQGFFLLIAGLALITTLQLPHSERAMIEQHTGTEYLTDEEAVLRYFSAQPKKGRVYVEYLPNYKKFPELSAHYLASRLYRETGFEPVVNSHLQESMSYRMVAGTMRLLKAKTYSVPLLFPDRADLSPADLLEQVRDFGITHVVCGRAVFCTSLKSALGEAGTTIGRYTIFTITETGLISVTEPKRLLVGYRDERGTLPFYLLQYYFYARADLYRKYELLALDGVGELTLPLAAVIYNRESVVPAVGRLISRKPLAYEIGYHRPPYALNHYAVHYPHNIEFDRYREIEEFLDRSEFIEQFSAAVGNDSRPEGRETQLPHFEWAAGGQAFSITNLVPGTWYRINYSYFPYWQLSGGQLTRGSGERMFLYATADTATGQYSPWSAPSSWIGLIVTLVAVLAMIGDRFRRPRLGAESGQTNQ